MQATPLLTASHRILSSVARLLPLTFFLRNLVPILVPKFGVNLVPIFVKNVNLVPIFVKSVNLVKNVNGR